MHTVNDKVLEDVVWVDPERMGGVACFRGSRLPVETLFVWLKEGYSLDEIIAEFPTITRENAGVLLTWAMEKACEEVGALENFAR